MQKNSKNKISKEKGKIKFENKSYTVSVRSNVNIYLLEIIMRDKYADVLRMFRKIHVQIPSKKNSSRSNKCFAYN